MSVNLAANPFCTDLQFSERSEGRQVGNYINTAAVRRSFRTEECDYCRNREGSVNFNLKFTAFSIPIILDSSRSNQIIDLIQFQKTVAFIGSKAIVISISAPLKKIESSTLFLGLMTLACFSDKLFIDTH
jgi:hypothetical protein